jgi:hypothetical protein
MSPHHAELLIADFSGLDREKLLSVTKDLQQYGRTQSDKIAVLRNGTLEMEKTTETDGAPEKQSHQATADRDGRLWLLAEQDYPAPNSTVIFYNGRTFEKRSVRSLQVKSRPCRFYCASHLIS